MGGDRRRHRDNRPMTLTASASLRDETRLLERHRQGDAEAFGELYRQFETMVYNLALRMSGNPADAEDITQETFVRAYRHLKKFKGKSSLKTWIYRIAINCSNTRLRKRGQRAARQVDDGEARLERESDGKRSPEERAVATDLSEAVRAGLEELPAHYREAVLLRDFEDMSYAEIAQILGVRIGTVRSRIARGREQVRQWLETRI